MMNNFNFDLQRFDDTLELGQGVSTVLAIGGQNVTLRAGDYNGISASLITGDESAITSVVVSLQANTEEFLVNGVKYGLATLGSSETNGKGIVVTIGSDSSTVGAIDAGDVFYVGSRRFSMKGSALLAGDSAGATADDANLNSGLSYISLVNNSLSAGALSSNWYKISEVDNKVLSIVDDSIFNAASGYKGIVALYTDDDKTATDINKYVSLAASPSNEKQYNIYSLEGASALEKISLGSALMSVATGGVAFQQNFGGSTTSPIIAINDTSLRVIDADSYFLVSGGYDSVCAALNNSAKTISLIGGSLTANQNQTVETAKYTLSSYNDSLKTYDGIVMYSNSAGSATLGGLDAGESFVLQYGSGSSATYKVTSVGLVKDGNTRPLVKNDTILSANVLSVADILAATEQSDTYYLDAKPTNPINIVYSDGVSSVQPTLIAYGNDAIATLTYNGTLFSLGSDNYISELNPGDWTGISLDEDTTLSLSRKFTGEGTSKGPLKIMREGSTFGIANFVNTTLGYVTLSGGDATLDYASITGVHLIDGSLNTKGQNVTLEQAGNISILANGGREFVHINSDSNGATINSASTADYNATIGRGTNITSTDTITIDSAGNTRLTTSFMLDSSISASQGAGSVIFVYGKDSGFAVTDLHDTESFNLTKSGVTTIYEVQNSKLISHTGNLTNRKIWYGEGNYTYTVNNETEYDLDSEKFKDIIAISDALTISNLYSAQSSSYSMANDETRLIFGVDSSNKINTSTTFGSLTRTSTSSFNGYELSRDDSKDTLFSSLTITDSLPIELKGDFSKTTITANILNASNQTKAYASLQSVAGSDFTISIGTAEDDVGVVNILGANSLNLSRGTLFTNDYTQTVKAGSYSVRAASKTVDDSTTSDDITIIMTADSDPTIGDIENGESFYINDSLYSRSTLGFTSDGKLYYPDLVSGTISDKNSAVAIKVSDLKDPVTLLAAETVEDTLYGKENPNVFTIGGGSNTIDAMVVNNTDSAKVKARYASFSTDNKDNYTLTTINDSTAGWDVDIISVMSAGANINYSLIDNTVTIVAAGSSAAFVVNSVVSGGTIRVDGSSDAPTIGGATNLTLLDGTITATNTINQTVQIGLSHTSLNAGNSVKVAYGQEGSSSLGTVIAANGNQFSLTNDSGISTLSVTSGNGVDFIVDTSDKITVTNFGDNTLDAFYYNGYTYSFKDMGLIRTGSGNPSLYLWTDDDSGHNIGGNSIALASLEGDYWTTLATVLNNTATVSSALATPVTFVNKNVTATYGTLKTVTGGAYYLTKSDDNTLTFDSVTIANGITNVYFDDDFLNKTITSANATLVPLTAATGNDTYQVSLSSNPSLMSLSGVSTAELVSGSLIADSNISLAIHVGSSVTPFKAGDTAITLISSDAYNSAVIIAQGASFATDTHQYTLGALGLTRDDSKYLMQGNTNANYTVADGTDNTTIRLASVTSDSYWAGLIQPTDSVLSINSEIGKDPLLVVNSTTSPAVQYAKISKTSTGAYFLESVTGNSTNTQVWSVDNTISIGDSSVSVASAFHDKNIVGENSGANFYFGDTVNSTVCVVDGTNGATISGAKDIHQSGGTIFANNGEQKITTSDKYSITYYAGDGIGVVVGSDSTASISSLNANDRFYVGDNLYTMTSASTLRTASNTKIFNKGVTDSVVAVSDIANIDSTDDWSKIITITGGVFTINPSVGVLSSLSNGETGIIIDSANDTVYGTLTSYAGGYSLAKGSTNTSLTSVNIVYDDENTFFLTTLSSDFVKVPIIAGETASLRVSSVDSDNFVVDYNDTLGVSVAGASSVSLLSGTIQTTPTTINQSVKAGSYNIYGLSSTSTLSPKPDDKILIAYNGSQASVGGLDIGEEFGYVIGSTSHTLKVTGVGLIRTSDTTQKLCEGTGFKDNEGTNGVFKVGSAFNTDIIGITDSTLDLSSQTINAAVVDDVDNPSYRIANLSVESDRSRSTLFADADHPGKITTVALGSNNSVPLYTDFEVTITTGENTRAFTINGDTYKATGTPLTIHSGDSVNNSSLLSGTVALNTTVRSVKTSVNSVSVGTGAISVEAAGNSAATLYGLNSGDNFKVGDTEYIYTTAGLFKSNQIFNDPTVDTATVTDLANTDNWLNIVTISSASVLSISHSSLDYEGQWYILNSGLDKICGTLKAEAGVYSISSDSWDTANTIEVGNNTTVYFPTTFDEKVITGESSGAVFKVTDYNTAFTVTDSTTGATIGDVTDSTTGATIGDDATQISMKSGTIALPKSGQTVTTANTNYAIAVSKDSISDDGITVIMDGKNASLGSLNIGEGNQDKFIISADGSKKTFSMLSNGRISRSDNKYWLSTAIADGGTVPIAYLLSDSDDLWGGYITIADGLLTINSSMTSALIVDKSDNDSIYGKLLKDGNSYTLDSSDTTTSVNATLKGITVNKNQTVKFAEDYMDIPITAGDTTFEVTAASGDSFTVNYPASLGTNATGVSLIGGKWALSDTNQTVTANDQSILVGGTSPTISVTAGDTLTISGLNAAGEIATISNTDGSNVYSIGAGDGISINIANGVQTISGISTKDVFAIDTDEFTKSANGFVKKDSDGDYYLWTADDVTSGVALSNLNLSSNWLAVETVDNRNVVIDSESKSVVFINSIDNVSSIYGALTVDTNGYNLSNVSDSVEANAMPTLITVQDVIAGISSYYTGVTISAAGASFAVNALTSGSNNFSVGAKTNATLGNVANVNLLSGTLTDLTSITTAETSIGSIVAKDSSKINVGFDGSIVTISALGNDESFDFDGNTYTYKAVGIVKDGKSLFVNDALNGSVTSDSLTSSSNYQTMFESDGTTITLQSNSSGVFVDSASTDVSEVYAKQTYSDNSYTIDTLDSANHTIDASNLNSDSSITANYATKVLTSTGKYTVNDRVYNAVGKVTIDTATDPASSLNAGTVSLTKNNSLAISNVNDTISVSGGNGISVTAADSEYYTLSGLNQNDAFTIGDNSYTMKSKNFMVRTSSSTEALYINSISDTLASGDMDEADNWVSFVQLDNAKNLNLSTISSGGGIVVAKDFSAKYASLEAASNSFTLSDLADGAGASLIAAINLGSDSSTLTTNFAATVKTETGSNTYTVNGNPYTAKSSALTILASEDSSAITRGVISLANSPTITISTGGESHTISGTAAEVSVGSSSMKFTLADNDTFELDGANYELTAVGLIKDTSAIWTVTDPSYYILPNASTWSNMKSLETDGSLDLSSDVSDGSTIIIDNAATKRIASLNYSDNSYALTSINDNSISAIQLGNATSNTLSITTNFDSTITTGDGVYSINNKTYNAASGAQIAATSKSSSLYGGTVSLVADSAYNSVASSASGSVTVTGGDLITATATSGTLSTLGNLNSGDTFKIGSVYYKVLEDGQTFVQVDSSGTPSKLYDDLISGTLEYTDIVNDANFANIIGLKDGVLDLTSQNSVDDGWSAIVVTDASNPTTRVAQISYTDADGYKLETTAGGVLTNLDSVKLGAKVNTFTTDLDITINTTSTGTYTINGDKVFNAQNDLKIVTTTDGDALLANGTVSLAQDVEVTTSTDEVIKSTSGTITVTVSESAGTVTIGGLNAGETFTVGDTEYTMTNIGLLNGTLINTSVASTKSILTTDLSGSNWQTILSITDGALALTSSTASDVLVVDLDDYTKAVSYGTLTKSGDTYTLTQGDNDDSLTSISLTGTKATFGTKANKADITAGGATFKVTSTGDFTVNAATSNSLPTISGAVTGITLNAGTIQATIDLPITAGARTITATSGDITVTNTDGTVTINDIDEGDEFTLDDKKYKMLNTGLFNDTDNKLVTTGYNSGTLAVDEIVETQLIAVSTAGALNLSQAKPGTTFVVDTVESPSYIFGNLIRSGYTYTLEEQGTPGFIKSITMPDASSTLTLDFDATINTTKGSKTYTINGNSYVANASALVISVEDSTSKLYSGKITLDAKTNTSATDSEDNILICDSGTFNASASGGSFETITNLGDKSGFTYDNKNYTQGQIGLVKVVDDTQTICINIPPTTATITLAELDGMAWNAFIAPTDKVLDISALSATTIICNNASAPSKHLATFSTNEGQKTLAGQDGASNEIQTVIIAADDNLTIDFNTQINSPIGTVTVNDKTYAGTTDLVINSVITTTEVTTDETTETITEKTSKLYSGKITLDRINSTATDLNDNTLAREHGDFIATAEGGTFTTIEGLDVEESFTYNGVTYTQSAQGLRNGSTIRTDLAGTTINLSDLYGSWENILAPVDGVLDISAVEDDAIIYDSATNPATQLATLTVDNGTKTLNKNGDNASAITTVTIAAGDILNIDFATQVSSPIGAVTVNGKDYVGTSALTITSDGATSTLTQGTVSLTDKDDAVTTTGGSVITYTTKAGDGMTVEVDNSSASEEVTLNALTNGDTFTVGATTYTISAVGPINSNNELWKGDDYTAGITLDALNTAANWTTMLAITDDALSISAETLADGDDVLLVDNATDPTKLYGELVKADGSYTLIQTDNSKAELTSITASGVKVELAAGYAGINLFANDSAFTNTALNDEAKTFTLDTTTTPSLSADVQSLTLTAGTIAATANQTVTAGENIIKPTTTTGSMVIGLTTISGIATGDAFTLNGKDYKMLNTGLFDDTDNKLVTDGFDSGTLTIADIAETQLLAISTDGTLDLTQAETGNSLVVDTVESPAAVYGSLTKAENIYTLNKQADGIKSITMPNANSTLTTDVAATINTPSSSNTFYVNSKKYKANSSALVIASNGTTSTLTQGTISLADKNDTVTTTSGSVITYTADGDGMTIAVDSSGTITFGGLTTGDTFTVGTATYTITAAGPINSAGALWKGDDYTAGITLDALNTASNWTTMLAITGDAISINADTLADGGDVLLVDSVTNPTKLYGNLTKADGTYTLTQTDNNNATLTSITASEVKVELAAGYAGVNLVANDSAFSNTALTETATSFTLDTTNATPTLSDKVQSLTLTAGTIAAAVNQTVTAGANVITPTTITGSMVIGTTTIDGIVEGDAFTLNNKAYKVLSTGLFDDTDNKLVTEGFDSGTLTIADIVETQLFTLGTNGTLDLSQVAAGNTLVVDKVESPATIYGALTKTENIYTLNNQTDGINSITMPEESSTLTTDIAATITTPTGSNTFTINGNSYTAANSALVIESDGTTSTLTDGKISLLAENDAVTTTGGNTITYTATDGDGMTVEVEPVEDTSDDSTDDDADDDSGEVTNEDETEDETTTAKETIKFDGLTTGDTFTVNGDAYKISAVGPVNSSSALWTGGTYSEGITLDALNNADNWTTMLAARNDALAITADTLADGGEFIVVDNINDPTQIYGNLTRAGGSYSLTQPDTTNATLTAINTTGVKIELAPEFAGVNLKANSSSFSNVTISDDNKNFTLDGTGTTPTLSDNVNSLTLTDGTIAAAVNQTVTVGTSIITPTTINGSMIIGMTTIDGITTGDAFTLGTKAYKMLDTGLFNDTDNKLVTTGYDSGTLTIASIDETQLIAVSSSGTLDLNQAATGNSIVVDKVESPTKIYGALTKDINDYTLNEQGTAGGISSITLPNTTSTLTTDITATINATTSSNTYTINRKKYIASSSALVIASDGTTSTLTDGTITLADESDTVTTTSGTLITYTTDGDGMTVTARASGSVLLEGLTAGDTFNVGSDSYRVTQLGFLNNAGYLWTSTADYRNGVLVASTGNDGINNADNWSRAVACNNGNLSVQADTLADGISAIVIDSATAATKTLGTLTRSGNTYTLTKSADEEKMSSISLTATTLKLQKEFTDVPITAAGATFTVTADNAYTVDATGDTVSISEEATAIEISAGTIAATVNQTVTATTDSGTTKVISSGNGDFNIGGETFTVAGNEDGITFGMTNGVPDTVSGFEKDATVVIDGDTYTSPADNSTLKYTETDGWYFDGYIPTSNKYNITIDILGNVTVDSGVKFSDVVSSGRTLPEDKTIKLAFDVNNHALNVTSQYPDAINIYDAAGSPLVENLGKVSVITFDDAGVMVENLSDVPGAVFTLDLGQNLETEAATITANTNDCAVGVGTSGTSLSIDKAATVNAPENLTLTLGKAEYTVNGVDFTTNGTAQASLTSAGVKVDLAISDAITYDDTNFNGTGSATANLDDAGGISLTSGASVDGATGKTLNITGTVTLDANTIDAATATDVTAKAHGYAVANDDVTVTGDDDGYKLNIADGVITGLENIGNVDGVTIGGLSNGTIKTDRVGTFTVAGRTFLALGDSAVVYGIENGTLTTADDVDSVISGDFADGLKVNGGTLQVTGDGISLTADTEDNRKLSGFGNNSSLMTADGIVKIEPTGAGKFTFDGHTFETNDATIAFNLRNSHVTGIDSLENGTLIISQDETTFNVNDETIALSGISTPITLGIADSEIDSIFGMNGGITGLDDATVFGLSTATINGKYFNISGDDVDAFVIDGNISTLRGLDDGATVGSAPEISVRTTDNGKYVFRDDVYNINDTLDGIVRFTTDINSYVTDIDEFEGSISGNLEGLNLNGKAFSSSSDKVTVANDGEDVIALYGLSSGDTITGSLSKAEYIMPQGTLQVNDQNFILKGDEDGVSVSGGGSVILGLDRYGSLTVALGGDFTINSDRFNDAPDGTTFIAGRDHVYITDPNNKPIHEKTDIDDIIENLIGEPEPGTVSLSGDSAAAVIASGKLDSPMALTLDNNTGKTQNADFSNSSYAKRVTLIGGDQNVTFNDEGKNAAYVDPTATGRKNIALGNGGDVAVNDSPFAKVSVKTGTGADTIVNRNGAETTVDVENNGDTTIVPTSGRVTLQNYDENNHAKIRNFDYSDMLGAIKNNEITFGDGVMTLGDAVVVFDANASETGGTWANLVDYAGNEQRVGFTHTNGGVLNASTSGDDLVLKGNYAESSSDTQKTGPSTLISGSGDDTILAGATDYVRAGGGDNQIYVTDSNLRGIEGATIYLGDSGRTTVHNFNEGYDNGDEIFVNDVSAVDFTYGDDGLVMRTGNSQITFDGLEPVNDFVTYADNAAAPYQIKITNGKNEYNAAIAQEGYDIGINDDNEANVFYGNGTGGSGLNFSEYTGAVEVNLNDGTGNLNGSAAQIYNINKVQAGEGNATLIGKDATNNTLIAGTGNTNIQSGTGNDLMVGNTSEEKDGFTTFNYKEGDGRDTITGFDFMSDANDYTADIISLPAENIVTNVIMDGNDILMFINESANDYLRLQDAVGNDFKINDRIAKVETVGNFDNLADFYVVSQKNATMKVGANIGDAQVWLDDRTTGEHGVIYKGEIKYLDASAATGSSTLVGNDLDNVIYGGKGSNSIWGGYGANNDTLIGGSGQNTFFFGLENGSDTITSIKSGDVVYLANGVEQIASTTITSGGTNIELTDGSSLEIKGNAANIEYRLADGNKFTADHSTGKWNKK